MPAPRGGRLYGLLLSVLLLGACQSQLLLMPTPEVLKDARFNLFELNPKPVTTNEVAVLTATTRKPDVKGNKFFTGQPDTMLHLGYAELRIGEEDLNLFELIDQSTTGERTGKFAWNLLASHTLSSTPRPSAGTMVPGTLPPEMADYMEALNAYIEADPIKELTVYVHGANNTYYWSVSQAAQFRYFTGDNAMVLAFAWPSPGSIWGYGTDKRRSDEAATDLAYLIELLARYSVATRINLLAYSAGGRVVGGALAELGKRYSDPAALRIGQVYLTQSDQPLIDFVNALPGFFPLVEGLTVTAAVGDPVLSMARITDGKLRLGAAGEGDGVTLEISPELWQEVVAIVNSDRMFFIDLRNVPQRNYQFSHGAWYESPWVSTDVMATLLGGLSGKERGLVPEIVNDVQVWTFPDDYMERLKANVLAREARRASESKPAAPQTP